MSADTIEEIQLLFGDILEDAEKGMDATDPKEMHNFLQSILSAAANIQRKLQ